jgi:N-methylhydantoinase B
VTPAADSKADSKVDPKAGAKAFVFSECIMGTWGATSTHDGQEGVPHMASNQSNVPIEMIEADYPIRIEQYGLVADTGGAGKYRGGLGLIREYRMLVDDVYMGVRSDKCLHPPHGLFGGEEGHASVNMVNPGDAQYRLPSLPVKPVTLREGDVFRHVMAGGGGYGDRLLRDPALILEDFLDGKMTAGHAREKYGVVIDIETECVDVAASAALRETLRMAVNPV